MTVQNGIHATISRLNAECVRLEPGNLHVRGANACPICRRSLFQRNEATSNNQQRYLHKGGLRPPVYRIHGSPFYFHPYKQEDCLLAISHSRSYKGQVKGNKNSFQPSASASNCLPQNPATRIHPIPGTLHGKTRKRRHLLRHNKRPRTRIENPGLPF